MRLRQNAFPFAFKIYVNILFARLTVAAHELVYAACRVDELALARVERMRSA